MTFEPTFITTLPLLSCKTVSRLESCVDSNKSPEFTLSGLNNIDMDWKEELEAFETG